MGRGKGGGEAGRSSTVTPISTSKHHYESNVRLGMLDDEVTLDTNWAGDIGSVQDEFDQGDSLKEGLSGKMPFRRTIKEAEVAGYNAGHEVWEKSGPTGRTEEGSDTDFDELM